MAQLNLDDRVMAARDNLARSMGPQPPISSDNSRTMLPAIEVDAPDNSLSLGVVNPNGGSGSAGPTNGDNISGEAPVVGENSLPNPTPIDDTNAQLAAKRQQALEALKAEGFDGYTPAVTGGGDFTPDDQSAIMKAVTDIGAGFNVSLARSLSLPRETIERGMSLLGIDYMKHGSPTQNTIDALNRMGIPAYEVENTANKIGQGALPALATWATMQAAAPAMAANTGLGTLGYLGRQIGEWALKHPVVGLWLGQTSQAGGKVAKEVTGSESPLVEFGGEMLGGVAPGLAKGAVKMVPGVKPLGRLVGSGVDAISDVLPTELGNVIKKYNPFYQQPAYKPASESLINPNLDQNRLQTFSRDQITGAQTYQDKAIENAINSIPTTGTTGQIQTRTHDLLQQAEKISKRIVSGFWDRVPLKTKLDVGELRSDVIKFRRELEDVDNSRPDTMIQKVMDTVRLRREEGSGKIIAPKPTIQKLRDLQSQIGTAITEERARDAPREGQVRNLSRLSELIDDHIAREMPNNTSIEQARQMSRRHNDLFSRGPINDILSKRRTGDFRVPVADSVDTLLQKTDGLAALKAVQDGVSTYPRIPTTRFMPKSYFASPYAVTDADKSTLDQMIKSAEDSIRASFREAAEAGPQKAVAYSVKNEEGIKALSKVAGEVQFAAQRVADALAEKKYLASSALAKFSETSPEKAVQNIFAQRDPRAVAGQLMLAFKGDPDALEGLRNQVLNEFIYNKAKTNPNVMQKMMQEPRIQNLMEHVLAPEQLARLNRIISTAVRVGAEDETGIKSFFRAPAKMTGRIVGAAIGRRMGSGTIQVPGMFSKATGNFMERMLGGTDPSDLLSQAVIDPHWEALLYSRLPATTKDMRSAQKLYGRVFNSLNTAQQAAYDRMGKEKDND